MAAPRCSGEGIRSIQKNGKGDLLKFSSACKNLQVMKTDREESVSGMPKEKYCFEQVFGKHAILGTITCPIVQIGLCREIALEV